MDCGCAGSGETIFLSVSKGVCRECGKLIPVRYVARENQVFLERHCPEHGTAASLVAESLDWYLKAQKFPIHSRKPVKTVAKTVECPRNCGPCSFHAQRCNLPVVSITNACELRCPICFTYNRKDRIFHMSVAEFERHLDFVVESTGGVDLINITGGEPTLHPELLQLLAKARRPGIGRVTMNTNGLRLAHDPDLAKRLAELGVYVVLSLDTLESQRSIAIHGRDIVAEKLRALEVLAEYDVQTTLLMVLIGGVNEDELGKVVALTMSSDFVRSLTIQTMAYTGQGGKDFLPRRHIPVDGVERRLEEAGGGFLRQRHFFPLPTAHPLCYGVGYFLVESPRNIFSFTDILRPEQLAGHLGEGYLIRPTEQLQEDLRLAIERIWSENGNPELLAALRKLLQAMYPTGVNLSISERQRRAEKMIKTIYIHAHMDEDTFEVGRVIRCPDQVPDHAERLISACNYNLFYRQRDERFWLE